MRTILKGLAAKSGYGFFLLLMTGIVIGMSAWPALAAGKEAQEERSAGNSEEYIIGIGDILSVQVWKEPELSKTLTVRTDGRISMPLVGDIEVSGKSIRELTGYLSGEFSKVITEPAVSITLVENRSKRYYLIGQVQQPGEFPIDHPITILQALARGGGFLEWAQKDKIAIVRQLGGREKRIGFNYEAFVKGKKSQGNIMISPGDTIIVP